MPISSFKSFVKSDLHESLTGFLCEGRIDFLKTRFKDKLDSSHDTYGVHKNSDDIIDHFATHADPTHNKKHTEYVLEQYAKGHIRQEDAPGIRETLGHFDRVLPKLEKKQIKQYPKISDLRDAIEPHIDAPMKGKGESLKHPGTEIVHDSPHMEVAHIKNFEGSQHCADSTEWCTRHADAYKSYKKNLFAFRDKKTGEKYQMHADTNSMMDKKDNPVSVKVLTDIDPTLKQHKTLKAQHPGFNTFEENSHMYDTATPEWKSLLAGMMKD